MGARLIKAAENIIAVIVRLFRWWFRQIGQQNTVRGKAVVAGVGLFALCIICSVPVALVNGPRKTAPAAAVAPSAPPTAIEADVSTARPTPAPATATLLPSPTSEPPTNTPVPLPSAIPPTATPEPTKAPAPEPQPTAAPTPAQPVVATNAKGVAPQGSDCPPKYPVKGNQSGIYHTPSSRYYKRTKPEWCFATAADAAAAGFRPPEQ